MKKFLFTLATLLMAGTAFADSYMYIDKFEVTADMVGTEIEVPVKAHFSEYVSAFEVWFTMPEGMEITYCEQGSDMTISYIKANGKTGNLTAPLYFTSGHYITAVADPGYNADKTSYGCVKWAPGDYDEILLLTIEITDAYNGGDIVVRTEPSCGQDNRNIPMAVVAGGNNLPWVDASITADEPTLAVDNEENPTQVTTSGVLYKLDDSLNPGVWRIEDAPYTLPEATNVEQVLNFMAYTPNDEGKNDSKFVYLTFTIPAKAQEFVGTADVTFNENVATLTYTSNDPNATVEVKVGETATTVEWIYDAETETYTATYEVEKSEEPGEHSVTVTLTVTPSDNYTGEPASDSATYTYKVNDNLKGDITISDPDEDGKVTVTYNPGEGDPENVELTVVVKDKEGNEVEATFENGVITLPDYGEYTVTVTASAEGYNDKTFDPETVKWEKKEVAAPKITYTTTDTEVVVTIEWPESDGEHVYTGEYRYERTDVDQSFDVEAYVTEGETYQESEHATETIPVPKKEVIATPTITFSGEETTTMTITVSCETEGVTLYVNGEAVTSNPYTYTVTRDDVYTAGTVEVTAVAKKGDLESETANGSKAWVVQKKPVEKPTIVGANLTATTYDIVITPDANTDGALVYTANPEAPGAKAQPVTLTYERKDADYTVHVTAMTEGTDTYQASELAEADIVIPAKQVYPVKDPEISVDKTDPTKTVITITAEEGNLSYTLTDEDGNVIPATAYTAVVDEDGNVTITIPNGNEVQFVTVTATTTMTEAPAGYAGVTPGEATKTVEIPALPKTKEPTIDVSFGGEDGAHYANVTFKNNDEKAAVIEYSLDDGETWITYTGAPVVITNYGENTVLARATAEGKQTSDEAERTFTLNDDPTSVNELTNGKAVAGVRYFNMAGQEMQEANGITIVVTTYTDGTTSAVKVIK